MGKWLKFTKMQKKIVEKWQKWRFWAEKWPKKAFSGVQNP